ncbi:MAG: prolipoprotein diacylglyceryl transferase [Chloroflexota bacterium]|nr:prolipoprotein diacylglyceryl transferase [Chloroflexota bacterium]
MLVPSIVYVAGSAVRTYSFVLALAVLLAFAWAIAAAQGERGRAANACLLALAAGLLLARLEYVLLEWRYFQTATHEIFDFAAGGLGWHGAAWGSWLGLWLGWRAWRMQTPFAVLLTALAPAVPVFMAAGWLGCAAAGCGYGSEVRTLADYPPLVTAELPDVFGIVAPRWNTPLYGVVWASVVFVIVVGATRWLAPTGFWLALVVGALGTFVIGYARADAVPFIAGLRADQWLDLGVFALGLFAVSVGVRRRKGSPL